MDSTSANNESKSRRARRKPESLSKIKSAARKLFVERGYDATRPQDIAREAGLGHGTFYLHYPDKRSCFLAFVEEARQELEEYLRLARRPDQSLEDAITATLNAIRDYSDAHPGALRAALTDASVIDAGEGQGVPMVARWGQEWSDLIRGAAAQGEACGTFNAEVIGQAVAGALHQAALEGARSQESRVELADNLSRFLLRALRPD
ncbi:MAG TPA: TetR/AcrR family transcriptional regulator [Rhizomicrobium sp.]|jgi:AcrR family transcriptional regulator|nr:TetR/AcrR family transcriptional regulator [Rhizomicrobium sp.]